MCVSDGRLRPFHRWDHLSEKALLEVANRFGDKVATYAVDVSDLEALSAVVDKIENDLGAIEHVFACAGVARVGPTLSVPRSDVELMTRVNYGGVVNLVYAVLPRMIERHRGEFAVVASLTGIVAPHKMAAYGATKAAVIGFLESLRYEIDGTGVKLACVCPEAVKTPMATDFFENPNKRGRALKTAITPRQVVATTEKGLARGRFLVLPGPVSKGMWRVQRLLPGLTRALQSIPCLSVWDETGGRCTPLR
ncbi:SDR family NAD(P)-dependent oxidoreductase [Nocardia sp. alder85J]|uniref:SDR family NAD(P)-dependent oxidoreductase n=1 Tax=Nocardia sp. alder85J TaxID=2862949 RepID=UPI0022593D0A|nr:SDR family NAD(P)-dependent oxidoreductase [Nocardia sp. alder85J]MCX4098610.1 SDR family NAD(P)-dependent oxidoreductase [Nocardia sp. alder85J]